MNKELNIHINGVLFVNETKNNKLDNEETKKKIYIYNNFFFNLNDNYNEYICRIKNFHMFSSCTEIASYNSNLTNDCLTSKNSTNYFYNVLVPFDNSYMNVKITDALQGSIIDYSKNLNNGSSFYLPYYVKEPITCMYKDEKNNTVANYIILKKNEKKILGCDFSDNSESFLSYHFDLQNFKEEILICNIHAKQYDFIGFFCSSKKNSTDYKISPYSCFNYVYDEKMNIQNIDDIIKPINFIPTNQNTNIKNPRYVKISSDKEKKFSCVCTYSNENAIKNGIMIINLSTEETENETLLSKKIYFKENILLTEEPESDDYSSDLFSLNNFEITLPFFIFFLFFIF
ncbi:transmission-blocking target antigen s230, putative [Plasmodium gallinaceum]|uniref:Transmission-blocking target antigen s230, putative n=1 Tax=Plasmodium gallinaceum TaxID=5849 RepID=A0A1J1GU47_PLAGA|nr:transmission-blocking target antigen s230, putative [Plasmodium gallinaceum]CRG94561.1 transmission-blocking target antigen s230, putative [Plasmodium gallinaceum]